MVNTSEAGEKCSRIEREEGASLTTLILKMYRNGGLWNYTAGREREKTVEGQGRIHNHLIRRICSRIGSDLPYLINRSTQSRTCSFASGDNERAREIERARIDR